MGISCYDEKRKEEKNKNLKNKIESDNSLDNELESEDNETEEENNEININFNFSNFPQKDKNLISVNANKFEKIENVIHRYLALIGNNYKLENMKFIFNAKVLNISLTLAELGIVNNSFIFVVAKIIKNYKNEKKRK